MRGQDRHHYGAENGGSGRGAAGPGPRRSRIYGAGSGRPLLRHGAGKRHRQGHGGGFRGQNHLALPEAHPLQLPDQVVRRRIRPGLLCGGRAGVRAGQPLRDHPGNCGALVRPGLPGTADCPVPGNACTQRSSGSGAGAAHGAGAAVQPGPGQRPRHLPLLRPGGGLHPGHLRRQSRHRLRGGPPGRHRGGRAVHRHHHLEDGRRLCPGRPGIHRLWPGHARQ